MQLRDNNEWLAKDLVKQFPSFAGRYIYDNTDSGEYGKFIIDKMRDPKMQSRRVEIQNRTKTNDLAKIRKRSPSYSKRKNS